MRKNTIIALMVSGLVTVVCAIFLVVFDIITYNMAMVLVYQKLNIDCEEKQIIFFIVLLTLLIMAAMSVLIGTVYDIVKKKIK